MECSEGLHLRLVLRAFSLFFLISTSFLCGCGSTYQALGFAGGYTSMPVARDIYRVTYRANVLVSAQQLQTYFLRRCADVALENGAFYFSFLAQQESYRAQEITLAVQSTSREKEGDPRKTDAKVLNVQIETAPTTKLSVVHYSIAGVIQIFAEGAQPADALDARRYISPAQSN